MNYIIFDLELNSKIFKSKLPNEIIEIGAVKLDENLKVASIYQSFVKPKIHKKLFPIIKRKTKISQAEISRAELFKTILPQFKAWIGKDYILCSWGHDDIHHLKSNCELNRISTKWLARNVDIQKQFSSIHNLPSGQRFSLKKALNLLDIPIESELHRADVDAMYTSQVFIKTFDMLELEPSNSACKILSSTH